MFVYFFVTLAILGAWFALALIVGSFLGRLFKYGQPTFQNPGNRERVGLDPRLEQADRWHREIA